MKLTKRQSKIASLLLKQVGYQTVKHYAEQLNISERTIHSDLKAVEKYLVYKGYSLEKRPGVGIRLVKSNDQFKEDSLDETSDLFSGFERKKKIVELLLLKNATVTYESLAHLFLTSKTSIKNDLRFIKNLLIRKSGLTMVSNSSGTRISGTEYDIQKALVEYNRFVMEESLVLADDVDGGKEKILCEIYGETVVAATKRILYSYFRNDSLSIAEHYVFNVFNMMTILAYRLINDHHIESKMDDVLLDKNAYEMLEKLSLRLNFTFTDQDVAHLSKYLLSNKFETLPSNETYNKFVEEIISKVSDTFKYDFTIDYKLKEQLSFHIPAMTYRLKHGILINNPFCTQIKKEFSVIYNLIWIVMSEFEERLNIVLNEDEIGFLTLYFQSAIERSKLNKRILIVCPTGIATSEILFNRIVNLLPSLTSIEVSSIKEINGYNLEKYDLIISTADISVKSNKIVIVNPLLSSQDMKNISTVYNERFIIHENADKRIMGFKNLLRYVDDDYIFINQLYDDRVDFFKKVGEELLSKGIIVPKAITNMISREDLGGTDMPIGVAIPHSNPKYVQKTKIVLTTLKKSMKWNEYNVNLIIMVCIAEEDRKMIKGILTDIYELVENREIINGLSEVNDKEELKALMSTGN